MQPPLKKVRACALHDLHIHELKESLHVRDENAGLPTCTLGNQSRDLSMRSRDVTYDSSHQWIPAVGREDAHF